MARGDDAEVALLGRSCPSRSYTQADLNYSRRWSALVIISHNTIALISAIAMETERLSAWVELLEKVHPFICDMADGQWFDGFFAAKEFNADSHREGGLLEGLVEQVADQRMHRIESSISRIVPTEAMQRQVHVLIHRASVEWKVFDEFLSNELAMNAEEVLDALGAAMAQCIRSVLANAATLPDDVHKHLPKDYEVKRAQCVRECWANMTRSLF